METWFLEVLGYPYDQVILGKKIGFPSVHCEADFRIPCGFGEVLAIELSVAKIGRSSICFDYRVRTFGQPTSELRLRGATVCVAMDLDPDSPAFRRSLPIPADLRARFEAFMAGQAMPQEAREGLT